MKNKPALLRYRFLAFILDGAILNIPSLFLLWYIGASTSLAQLGYRLMIYLIVFLLTSIWWVLWYDVYFTTRFGGTLGKLITGLRITDMDGKNLSVKKSLFRYTIGYAFSFLLFAAGFWAIIKDPLKQGWHDKATGSKVVMVANRWLPSLILIILFYSLHIFLLVTTATNAFTGPLKTEVVQIFQEASAKQTIQKKTAPGSQAVSQSFTAKQKEIYTLMDKKQYTQATVKTQDLLKTSSTNFERAIANRVLGEIAQEQGNKEEARTFFITTTKLAPDYAYGYDLVAEVDMSLYKDQEALLYAQKAVQLDSQVAVYHNDLAVALYHLGKTDDAIQEMKKAIQLDPKNPLYLKNLEQMQQKTAPGV